jgi:ribonuclease D
LDASFLYKKLFPDYKESGGFSLANVVQRLTGKKLCKVEQMSNWEKRPLRESQKHYAALDSWILIEVVEKLFQIA